MVDTQATRFVDTASDVDPAGEGTVRKFPRDTPSGREPTLDAHLGGAVGSGVTAPQVVFTGAVDVGFEAFADGRHPLSLEALSRCGEFVSQSVSQEHRSPGLQASDLLVCRAPPRIRTENLRIKTLISVVYRL
jgi:hypothetical protein